MKFEDIKVGQKYLVNGHILECCKKEEVNEIGCEPRKTVVFTDENKTIGTILGEESLHMVEVIINTQDWDVSGVNKDFHKTFVKNEFQSLDDWLKQIRKNLQIYFHS